MNRRWLFLFMFAAALLLLPTRAAASVVEICNKGNVSVDLASAIHTVSLLSGESYHVSGWYVTKAGDCTVIYSSSIPEWSFSKYSVYVGIGYWDAAGRRRTHVSSPDNSSDEIQAVSEKFCVGVGVVFDYKTTTRDNDGSCRYGFNYDLLEFTLQFTLSATVGRLTYTIFPDRFDGGMPTPGGQAEARANLLLGDEVHLAGGKWRDAKGVVLSGNLISDSNLPPLRPKRQFSVNQPPVAGAIQKINGIMSAFRPCTDNSYNTTTPVADSRFEMNDFGAAISRYTWSTDKAADAAAIANFDLARAEMKDLGSCWTLFLVCKRAAGSDCMQGIGARRIAWQLFVNTREQAATILDALRVIAPYYPDGTGEMR